MIELMKVKASSSVTAVAGSIAHILKSQNKFSIQVVGAGALNVATKALIIARGYLAPSGIDFSLVPSFQDVEIFGEKKTAIRFTVQRK